MDFCKKYSNQNVISDIRRILSKSSYTPRRTFSDNKSSFNNQPSQNHFAYHPSQSKHNQNRLTGGSDRVPNNLSKEELHSQSENFQRSTNTPKLRKLNSNVFGGENSECTSNYNSRSFTSLLRGRNNQQKNSRTRFNERKQSEISILSEASSFTSENNFWGYDREKSSLDWSRSGSKIESKQSEIPSDDQQHFFNQTDGRGMQKQNFQESASRKNLEMQRLSNSTLLSGSEFNVGSRTSKTSSTFGSRYKANGRYDSKFRGLEKEYLKTDSKFQKSINGRTVKGQGIPYGSKPQSYKKPTKTYDSRSNPYFKERFTRSEILDSDKENLNQSEIGRKHFWINSFPRESSNRILQKNRSGIKENGFINKRHSQSNYKLNQGEPRAFAEYKRTRDPQRIEKIISKNPREHSRSCCCFICINLNGFSKNNNTSVKKNGNKQLISKLWNIWDELEHSGSKISLTSNSDEQIAKNNYSNWSNNNYGHSTEHDKENYRLFDIIPASSKIFKRDRHRSILQAPRGEGGNFLKTENSDEYLFEKKNIQQSYVTPIKTFSKMNNNNKIQNTSRPDKPLIHYKKSILQNSRGEDGRPLKRQNSYLFVADKRSMEFSKECYQPPTINTNAFRTIEQIVPKTKTVKNSSPISYYQQQRTPLQANRRYFGGNSNYLPMVTNIILKPKADKSTYQREYTFKNATKNRTLGYQSTQNFKRKNAVGVNETRLITGFPPLIHSY